MDKLLDVTVNGAFSGSTAQTLKLDSIIVFISLFLVFILVFLSFLLLSLSLNHLRLCNCVY